MCCTVYIFNFSLVMKPSYSSKKEKWSDRPKCGQVKFNFGEETMHLRSGGYLNSYFLVSPFLYLFFWLVLSLPISKIGTPDQLICATLEVKKAYWMKQVTAFDWNLFTYQQKNTHTQMRYAKYTIKLSIEKFKILQFLALDIICLLVCTSAIRFEYVISK